MLKKYSVLKWSLVVIISLLISAAAFGYWFMSLIPSGEDKTTLSQTLPKDLPYLSQPLPATRGKILAVVTSCDTMGRSQKRTGYELTELARAYYVFKANGFEVEVASPKGGKPPVIIDWDDMGPYDYAFLNDTIAQQKTSATIPLEEVRGGDYVAVFFAGGKGAMFDFPQNAQIQSLVKEFYRNEKVIGAVCHGPAALVNVTLDDGSSLLSNKKVSCFTNEEELFLIPDAKNIFPFLLEDQLIAKGAQVEQGPQYLQQFSVDRNIVTGQNPWSTWALAEAMVRQLGYTPAARPATAEENTVTILSTYQTQGYSEAKAKINTMLASQESPLDRNLLAMHSLVAAMQWNLNQSIDMIRLLSYAKSLSMADE